MWVELVGRAYNVGMGILIMKWTLFWSISAVSAASTHPCSAEVQRGAGTSQVQSGAYCGHG